MISDTAYHRTIPLHARTYAIPQTLSRELGIRKYGYHGISHQYVVTETARHGDPLERFSAVSCHLGSGGASLCAVVDGQSIDNTMGYSPLQGLIMSTRCGDLDPGLALRFLPNRSATKAASNGSSTTGAACWGFPGPRPTSAMPWNRCTTTAGRAAHSSRRRSISGD